MVSMTISTTWEGLYAAVQGVGASRAKDAFSQVNPCGRTAGLTATGHSSPPEREEHP